MQGKTAALALGFVWSTLLLTALADICRFSDHLTLREKTRLQGWLLTSVVGVGYGECGRRCQANPDCKAFSYHRQSGECQQHSQSAATKPSSLLSVEGWVLGDRVAMTTVTGQACACEQQRPCNASTFSLVTCSKILCPTHLGYTLTSNICFRFVMASVNWAAAKTACEGEGALLFSARASKLQFMSNYLYSNGRPSDVWVGADDLASEGAWLWQDGGAVTEWTQGTGQPNNGGGMEEEDCGALWLDGGATAYALADTACNSPSWRLPYVCEVPQQ